MTAQPAPSGPPRIRPTLRVILTCDTCQRPLTEALNRSGNPVRIDCGPDGRAVQDPDGDWWAVRINGQWRVVNPKPGEEPPRTRRRFRAHVCPTEPEPPVGHGVRLPSDDLREQRAADTAWLLSKAGAAGASCAGNCGDVVARRYGPNASTLCPACTRVLEQWRASPAERRGPIPYGRLVNGIYTPRTALRGTPTNG